MRRGEIYWAELAPRSGAEQQGRRPVIILSHDGFNQTPNWRSIIVVPVSTSPAQMRRGPTAVLLLQGAGGLTKTASLCVIKSRRLIEPSSARVSACSHLPNLNKSKMD